MIGRHDDVHVQGDASDVAVPPHGPAPCHNRFAADGFEKVVQRPNDSPIAPRQVLRF
jgi:hypothetical protein